MNGIHTEALQVVDGPGLGQCEELTGVLGILTGDGEVTVVHLVNHEVGRRLCHRMLVTAPMLRVGFRHVDDGTALAVDTYGLGEHTWALALADIEGVELSHQVALHDGGPLLISRFRHFDGLGGFAVQSFLVNTYSDFLRIIGGEE